MSTTEAFSAIITNGPPDLESLRGILSTHLAQFTERIQSAVLQLEDESLEASDSLDKIAVTDQIEYAELGERLKLAVEFSDRATGFFEPWRELFYKPYQSVVDRKKGVLQVLDKSIKDAKTRMLGFERAERDRAELAAKKLADEQRQAEEARKLALATEAEQAGLQDEVVNAILDAPSTAPTPLAVPITRPQGVSSRENWQAEVTSKRELILAAAKDPRFEIFLVVDQPALNREAKNYKSTLAIPGVRAVDKGSLAVRR